MLRDYEIKAQGYRGGLMSESDFLIEQSKKVSKKARKKNDGTDGLDALDEIDEAERWEEGFSMMNVDE